MNRIVNSIEAKDIENHFHPYTNPQTLKESGPHVICRGEGVYVYDNSNTRFIEGMSGLWCASLGFNNKDLVEAAPKPIKEGVAKAEAEEMKKKFEEAGAKIDLK